MCAKHYAKFNQARKGRRVIKAEQQHGMTETVEYRTWSKLKSRCNNKNDKSYEYYGGRGIKVCERWSSSDGFLNFYADMGKRPDKHSIDRIDVNGDYEPSNCRWADAVTQSNNQRMRKTNKSGYKGLNFHKKTAKWCARKTIDGKRVLLGYFADKEDAVHALSN
jgi:hypothetical protein